MDNVFAATVSRHDEAAGITFLNWRGVELRAPLSLGLPVGAAVEWRIAPEQVRLPSNSSRPPRPLDTPLAARIESVHRRGGAIEAAASVDEIPGVEIRLSADAGIAVGHGVARGARIALRLRGESIALRATGLG